MFKIGVANYLIPLPIKKSNFLTICERNSLKEAMDRYYHT